MEDINKILAECYCIQHRAVSLEQILFDYKKIIKYEGAEGLTASHDNMEKLLKETAEGLHKISEKLADYANGHDIIDGKEDFLVQRYFEEKTNGFPSARE